jgi:hypothetical protein
MPYIKVLNLLKYFTKYFVCVRPDRTLQSLVYKLVPGLHRGRFYFRIIVFRINCIYLQAVCLLYQSCWCHYLYRRNEATKEILLG